ncbi:MAG: hypothetical protein WCQ72_03550, partial [Eubacteriales bacterium]
VICASLSGKISDIKLSGGVRGALNVGGAVGLCEKGGGISDITSRVLLFCGEDGKNIGGICGRSDGDISGVSSIMLYSEAQLADMAGRGENVGGIVGYNAGTLKNCVVGSATEMSYVAGGKNVGGIIGIQNTDGKAQTLSGEGSVSRAYCFGTSYVGGIIGSVPEKLTLDGWRSESVAAASESYAGGVAGYNAGVVRDCAVSVSNSSLYVETVKKYGSAADYVGGAVGYNCGIMSSGSSCTVTAAVAGHNYVGGVVGFNAATGTKNGAGAKTEPSISGWKLSGGYINGKNFVGGFIGLNLADDIFGDTITVKPNSVTGSNFIGGVIGGNIIMTKNNAGSITAKFSCDNFLGSVSGEAYTGGYIGYGTMLKSTGNANKIEADVISLYLGENGTALDSLSAEQVAARMDSLDISNGSILNKNQNVTFTLDGGKVRLSAISGVLYTGGAVGFMPEWNKTIIKNVVCSTPVSSTGALDAKADEKIGVNNVKFDYKVSYTGGITGYVGKNMTVDSCSVSNGTKITSGGTFCGGICEINAGEIKNCAAANFGSQTKDYVGGIAGLNLYNAVDDISGIINNCTVEKTVVGNDYAGGVCAVNMSQIDGGGSNMTGRVTAYGDFCGGIAAVNWGTVKNYKFSGFTVTAKGDSAGGAVGYNRGVVSKVASDAASAVTAAKNAGGLAGLCGSGGDIGSLTNGATVFAASYAGGIVGNIEDGCIVVISKCGNTGSVTAGAAYCGGIVSVLPEGCKIISCNNTADITASAATGELSPSGGLCAVSHGEIKDSVMGGSAAAAVTGGNTAGGITGVSDGVISGCTVINVTVSDLKTSKTAGAVGGVAGKNSGVISGCIIGENGKNIKVSAYYRGGSVGGAVGINEAGGTLSAANGSDFVIYAELSQPTGMFWTGGTAGVNNGKIADIEFAGALAGGSGSAYGCGGIAGKNSGASAVISGCINLSSVYATGESGDIARVGGIAGVNENSAVVDGCSLGNNVKIETVYAWVGGVVGHNTAVVRYCEFAESGNTVAIKSAKGDIGGIIGRNGIGGTIANCSTGKLWTVTATDHATDNTIAGICGYNCSAENQSKLINYAAVAKDVGGTSNVAGGIFGRLEIQGSNAWVISDCKNFGSVMARDRVGGIAGQLKYCGGTFENCDNYGTITAASSETGSGGIVGCTYNMNSGDTLTFTSCRNFGDIAATGKHGAGIIGNLQNTTSPTLIFTDCVNTGKISFSQNAAGIIAASGSAAAITVTRCRNYGSGSDSFWGITGITSGTLQLNQCVNIPMIKNPLASKSDKTAKSNYRLTSSSARAGRYISYITTPGVDKTNAAYQMADGSIETRWSYKSSNGVISAQEEAKRSFIITLSEKMTINSIDILWFGDKRIYEYSIYYFDDTSNKYIQIVNQNGDDKFYNSISCVDNTSDKQNYYSENVFAASVTSKMFKITVSSVKDGTTEREYISIYDIIFKNGGTALFDNTDNLIAVNGNFADAKDSYKSSSDIVQNGIGTDTIVTKDGALYIATVEGTSNSIRELLYDPVASSNTSKQIYDDVDDKILRFYKDYAYSGTPDAPSGLAVTDAGGGIYKLSWNDNSTVYGYTVEIYINGALHSTNKLPSQNSLFVSVGESLLNGSSQLYFTITAHGFDTENKSASVKSPSVTLKKLLAQPEFHVELVSDSSNCISAVLDNPEDYAGILDSIKIVVTSSNTTVGTIYPVTGDALSLISSPANFTTVTSAPVVAQAIVEDGASVEYSSSAKISYDAFVGNASYYSKTSMLSASIQPNRNSIGWQGVSDDDLSYTLTLRALDSKESYARSEMLVYDSALGCYASVSAAESRLSATNAQSQTITLDIPASVLSTDKTVIVRAYPWYTQNAMERFGYTVAENVTAAQLVSLTDTRKGGVRIYTNNGVDADGNAIGASLTNGYIIEYARDSFGSVLEGRYNVLYSVTLAYDSFSAIQLKSYSSMITKQPAPEDITCESEDGVFTFSWDGDKSYANAVYSVEIIGITKNGARVTLYTSASQSAKNVIITDKTWSYPSVEVTVKRLGTLYSGGMTEKLCAVTKTELDITLPLDSIAEPSVINTPLNGSGDAAADELRYLISWTSLTAKPVKRYTVYIADVIVDRAVNPAEFAAHTKWWSTDSALDNILLEKSASSMLIDIGETDFKSGTLYIWVIAEANETVAEGEIKYTDSQAEYIREFELPQRLGTPATPSFTPVYDAAAPVSMSQFKNKGVTMTVSGTTGENGRYVVQAYIYAEQPASDAVFGSGNPVYSLGRTAISNTLASAEFAFDKLDGSWAGYWLCVRVRAVSDSAISSRWVYSTVRLPMVKLDSPVLMLTGVTENVTANSVYPFLSTASAQDITITRDSVSFDEVEQADYYEITLGDVTYTVSGQNTALGAASYTFGSFKQNSFQSVSTSYSLAASVSYANGRFTLLLPNNSADGGSNALIYSGVTAAAFVNADREQRYCESDKASQAFAGTLYSPLPDPITATAVHISGGFTYNITASADCKLYIVDNNGTISPLGDGSGIYDLSAYAGHNVYIFARDISERSLVTSAAMFTVP